MVVIEDRNEIPSTAASTNDVSDGFETASDTDLGSDVDANDGGGAIKHEEEDHRDQQSHQQTEQENEKEQEQRDSQRIISSDDASIDDEELKQKALVQANEAKVEGNKLFVDAKYEEALTQYELALEVAPDMPSSVEIRSICHANRGVCFLKMGKYENTVKECTKALELNPMYVKALVRRGEAHEKLEHFEEAIAGEFKFYNRAG
ncbi:heat shock protein 70 (HSP70)-interacting protein, putative [Medicago truncatula]|uniref:Heat shock protein 70 (HSP70)-interacting protein, putative n=1 Tax=Medicago truncatula TaxID=3880 RepID=A0A072VBU3_MEDTR|nr:heat shock protein 70 (HSP70)-interacting protein, putative [Medicago truncatula]